MRGEQMHKVNILLLILDTVFKDPTKNPNRTLHTAKVVSGFKILHCNSQYERHFDSVALLACH